MFWYNYGIIMKLFLNLYCIQFFFVKMIIRLFSRVLFTPRKHINFEYCRAFTRSLSPRLYSPKLNSISGAPSSKRMLQYQELIDDHYAFVSISVIKQFLLHKDIVFSDGPTCILINCPLCGSLNSLFINKISGSFICNVCKRSGSWNLLELFITNPKNKIDIQQDEEITFGNTGWKKLVLETDPVNRDLSVNTILKEFAVPMELLRDLDVRMSRDSEEIYFPLTYNSDKSGFLTLKPDMVEETFPFKCAKGIIIRKRKSTSAIVVATLHDFLALMSIPLGHDIVCLPHGQQTLPQEILPLFEEYSKLILWFNNDSVSWGNMKMFAKKFVEERCSLVQPIESQPSPYECMKSGIEIPDIIKSAQEVAHHSIITFANLREDVLSELYNADKVSGVKWKRFPTLNSILKGHRRGELTILTGPTGSGKTTFISEYSLDLICSEVTTLWGSFEIRNQRLAKTMMTQLFEAPLDKNLDKYEEWADQFERLPLYFMTFYGQQPLDAVMETVKHATYIHDVVHVIIDNVQFMLGLSNNEAGFLDRFYRQDALIASFRNFASTFNCHVTLVIHPRKEREAEQLTANSIFGGAKAAQEADNILIIQNKISQSTLRTKKYLQVAKNRFSGDLGIMPLEFNKETLSFRNDKRD